MKKAKDGGSPETLQLRPFQSNLELTLKPIVTRGAPSDDYLTTPLVTSPFDG